MAFNPFKNKKISEPILVEDPQVIEPENTYTENVTHDDALEYDRSAELADTQEQLPPIDLESMTYEGEKIADLQETGLKTEEVLTTETPKTIQKQKFNNALLDTISLSFILEKMDAVKKKETLYTIFNNDISLKENKWYNTTLKKGFVNALSLTKHLFALKDNINEKNNDKSLYYTAAQYLTEISKEPISIMGEQITEELKNPEVTTSVPQVESAITTPVANDPKKENKKYKRTPEEHKAYWKELTEQLSNIDLVSVMEHIGANNNEDGQRGKWKIWETGDNVQITGQMWKSWKYGGGHGAISLLAHHLSIKHNIDTRIQEQKNAVRTMAIKELIDTFGDGDLSEFAASGPTMIFKEPFAMPHIIDFKINSVRHYLHEKRGIPMWIINKQIKKGYLFAGCRSDVELPKNIKSPEKLSDHDVWAVFLSVNGTAAEMRAIERNDYLAKIIAKGSAKDLGGFVLKGERDVTERTVSALEASVDACSYHAIYPGRVATSCMGVNYALAVKAAAEALEQGGKFQLAFDNDQPGNEAAVKFREELILEIGEEVYAKHALEGNIGYFDLGLRCLEESVAQNKTFYLDVQDNFLGIDAVKLFQDQATKKWNKETVKEWVANGSIKYLNVCPSFETIIDVEKEANLAFTKINSGKPYYLRIKEDKDEKPEVPKKREAFVNAFEKLAGSKFAEWEKNGSIIYNKDAIAKDWNEYFVYLKENKPEFKEYLNEQEKKYAIYSEKDENVEQKKKGKKM